MKFSLDNQLPLANIEIVFKGNKKKFFNILLDTGSSATILDTDLCEEIGLFLDVENGTTRKMYGIGGTEICIEQNVSFLKIDQFHLTEFTIQLGDVKEMHGFDGIIGSDFFSFNKLIIDYNNLEVRKS